MTIKALIYLKIEFIIISLWSFDRSFPNRLIPFQNKIKLIIITFFKTNIQVLMNSNLLQNQKKKKMLKKDGN